MLEYKAVSIGYTNFVPGTIKLRPEVGIELETIAGFARKYPDAKLEITGYSGGKANPLLSLGLADSVRNYLVANGVESDRITVKGDDNISEGRAKNRRVEISLLGKEENKGRKETPADSSTSVPELALVPQPATVPAPISAPADAPAPKAQPSVELRMMVKSIRVAGNSAIPTAELEALLADLVGSEHTLAELNEAAARITAHYHERGFIVSRAYIPPQEIKDGAVTISVQEGRINKGKIENLSRLADQQANEYFDTINSGDVLQAAPVERALLLLNETPGVGSARATLQPGASVGSADLVVVLSPSEAYFANIQMDNYGNYYTGENRLGAELAINSPLELGDMLTLRGLATDQKLSYAYLAYQIPLGGSGLRIGATYSGTNYSLESAYQETHGSATIGSVFTIYPFIRSQKTNLSGSFILENKELNDEVVSVPIDKQVHLATFGLTGDRKDKFGGGGITLFNLSLARGTLSMDDASLFFDTSAKTNGPFARFNYSINRQQRLGDSYSFFFALSGQAANKNLNSSEQFTLGGAYGVRAYPQGEGLGDEGRLATVELRRSFSQRLQAVLFYDAGTVIYNHNPYLAGPNTRTLSGGGMGINANIFGIDIKAYLAMRGTGGQPTSEPATANHKSRLWLQLRKYF
ncbi:MAG: ShlB/FhaC/HecB family hemolysin secretion/activation protein [Pseudomonadota bacterium]